MTREEAIKIIFQGRPEFSSQAAAAVDAYVALGMLKLDEPKSRAAKIMDACNLAGVGVIAWQRLLVGLEDAGLRIVEK
jgi:hypothetical protein